MMKGKQNLCLFLTVLIMALCFQPVFAEKQFTDKDHNRWLQAIIYGNEAYCFNTEHPSKGEKIGKAVEQLQDAIYLCLDQFNHYGEEKLAKLNQAAIPGIPDSISEIDFTGNSEGHRSYTHRGWKHKYAESEIAKSHPDVRKQLLMSVVNYVFNFEDYLSPEKSKKICEAMSRLLYNAHILADRYHSEKYYSGAKTMLLADDSNADTVINDLLDCFAVLFQEQKGESNYTTLITELKGYSQSIIKKRRNAKDNDSLKAIDVEYSQKIKKLLEKYVPSLLQKQEWFSSVFPAEHGS